MVCRLSLCAGVGKGAAVAKGLSCYLFVAAAVTECELVNAVGIIMCAFRMLSARGYLCCFGRPK